VNERGLSETTLRPAGYAALVERYGLEVIPTWHRSLVVASGIHRIESSGNVIEERFPAKYWPGDTLGDHLEFALKYDGTNLSILARLFHVVAPDEVVAYVRSKPTGKYARRLWFLYEMLTGTPLPVDDLTQGNYVDLLDPGEYYTIAAPRPNRRQRVNDNLLGDGRFCPTIRRTDALRVFEQADLPARCRKIVARYSPQLLRRAMSYLYTKETKSSFEIEHLKPGSTRTERFVVLLQLAESEDFCDKARLVDLQNRIVDPRFACDDYRTEQNYVGETVAWQKEKVHFVCPKPDDIAGLMAGLVASHQRMVEGGVCAVAHAAAVAYGFVFLHPFEDGNGRIHRFLIHNILARRGFTPAGIIFPVSAAMQRNPVDYDTSLESFSRPLLPLVEYTLDEEGRMTVQGDTADWYRFIDLTAQAEALFRFIELTIDTDLEEELAFLAGYDQTKQAISEIVDMPDRKIDLFVRSCMQNDGKLSARRRASHFGSLTDEEVTRMESALQFVRGDNTAKVSKPTPAKKAKPKTARKKKPRGTDT
jgi:hypothetical protein